MIMSQLAMGLSPLMGADPVRYHLRVTEPAQLLAQVRAQFPPTDRPEFAVQLPV